MNINKFTQKSIEAVNQCEKLAYQYGNPEIDQEHFLYSLLTIEDSLILKLIEKLEVNKDAFLSQAQQLIEKKPKVSGGQVYISKSLNEVLVSAEDESKAMGDEYVSVEASLPVPVEASKQRGEEAVPGFTVSQGSVSCRRCPLCGATRRWSVIIRRRPMIRWRSTVTIWWSGRDSRSWTRSSVVMVR